MQPSSGGTLGNVTSDLWLLAIPAATGLVTLGLNKGMDIWSDERRSKRALESQAQDARIIADAARNRALTDAVVTFAGLLAAMVADLALFEYQDSVSQDKSDVLGKNRERLPDAGSVAAKIGVLAAGTDLARTTRDALAGAMAAQHVMAANVKWNNGITNPAFDKLRELEGEFETVLSLHKF